MPGMNELADGTEYVMIYPSTRHVEEWKQEAEEHSQSLSSYIITRVNEARADTTLADPVDETPSEVEHLEQRIEELEAELERERTKNSGRPAVDDPSVVKQFLTDQAQSFETILQDVVESGVLEEFVARRVEDQLYHLAAAGEVRYSRSGNGWRLVDTGGDA